jgi:hypothetical protein
MSTTTAVRTWKGSKAVITVTLPDGTTDTAGGNRAARAQAVIVTGPWQQDGRTWGNTSIYGLRGDLAKAQAEVAVLHRGRKIHGTQAASNPDAVAVRVVDA